jgi:hypothetical protein
MQFELVPILSKMEKLYEQPISNNRFKTYLQMLQGNSKKELILPIGGYNPMAKPFILNKIAELKELNAEQIMQESLNRINQLHPSTNTIKVVLNLADDLKGGWTNRFTTDYDSKFKINALVQRSFCTPYFWTSETYTPQIIKNRTLQYAYRTLYQLKNGRVKTLADHLKQEIFALQESTAPSLLDENLDMDYLEHFYQKNKEEDNYNLIFSFFYGDQAGSQLFYPNYKMPKMAGFKYAYFIGNSSNIN